MSNGTSKKTYSCFICEKNGYPDERVYLAGKEENGKTIYISEDGVMPHQHKERKVREEKLIHHQDPILKHQKQ